MCIFEYFFKYNHFIENISLVQLQTTCLHLTQEPQPDAAFL